MSDPITPSVTFMPVQKHLKLDTLPMNILILILQHVFPIAKTVTPFFCYGTSLLYLRGYGINGEHRAIEENLDLSFLALNRACYEIGTKLLYGTNYFRLENREWTNLDWDSANRYHCRPDIGKWWFNKIGERNLKMIKRMTVFINSGWVADRRNHIIVPSPFEMSYEEHWLGALRRIFNLDIKFNRLKIVLFEWQDLRFDTDYREEDKVELNTYRKLIVDLLPKFRGQKHVELQQRGHSWVGPREMTIIQMSMIQRGGNQIPPPPPRMGLGALLAHCRWEWEEKHGVEKKE